MDTMQLRIVVVVQKKGVMFVSPRLVGLSSPYNNLSFAGFFFSFPSRDSIVNVFRRLRVGLLRLRGVVLSV